MRFNPRPTRGATNANNARAYTNVFQSTPPREGRLRIQKVAEYECFRMGFLRKSKGKATKSLFFFIYRYKYLIISDCERSG